MIEDKEKVVDKIRKLLNKAEGTSNENEANTFFAKAQALMIKYAVDEAELIAKGERRREEIVTKCITIDARKTSRQDPLRSILNVIAECFNCKMWFTTLQKRDPQTGKLKKIRDPRSDNNFIAGFESDVQFVELMFYSVQMQLHSSILREMKKAKAGYEERGLKFGKTVWLRNFTEGYLFRIGVRMQERYRRIEEDYGGGAALALRDKKTLVDMWAEENLSNLEVTKNKQKKYDPYAQRQGREAGERADISGGRGHVESRRQGELT